MQTAKMKAERLYQFAFHAICMRDHDVLIHRYDSMTNGSPIIDLNVLVFYAFVALTVLSLFDGQFET